MTARLFDASSVPVAPKEHQATRARRIDAADAYLKHDHRYASLTHVLPGGLAELAAAFVAGARYERTQAERVRARRSH